jgi:hypothetical protein
MVEMEVEVTRRCELDERMESEEYKIKMQNYEEAKL